MPEINCPCGTQKLYHHCCQPLISGQLLAADNVSLMRSRYTAYSLKKIDYLVETWHPSTCPLNLKSLLLQEGHSRQWLGLNLISSLQETASQGFVKFFAHFQESGKKGWIYETSRFVQLQSRWVYIDGVHHQPALNETCPCGSSLKFKRCCKA